MTKTAKLFRNGRSQAVRLPAEFRFEGTEVRIRRNPATGEVILSAVETDLADWLALRDSVVAEAPDEVADFEVPRDGSAAPERDWP